MIGAADDDVIPAFLAWCEAEGIAARALTRWSEARLSVRIPEASSGERPVATLSLGGDRRALDADGFSGVWVRGLPTPPEVDDADRDYALTEYYSVLVTALHVYDGPVLGRPQVPVASPALVSPCSLARDWSGGGGVSLFDAEALRCPTPLRAELPSVEGGEAEDPGGAVADLLWIRLGKETLLLSRAQGMAEPTLEGAWRACDDLARRHALPVVTMALALEESGGARLLSVQQTIAPEVLIRYADWAFPAVISAIGSSGVAP